MLKFSQNLLENLRPRAITRDLDWGVPVPLDGWRDQPLKRLYVWFDAVIGYLSASVEWAADRRSDAWREWWINPDARGYYFMGKDNIVFSLRDLAGDIARPQRGRRSRWRGRPAWRAPAARRAGVERVPDDERLEVLHQPRPSDLRRRLPARVRSGRPAVLHRGGWTGDHGHRLHVGRVRPAHELRAGQWWGNLVNRSISMAYKNNAAIPSQGTRSPSMPTCWLHRVRVRHGRGAAWPESISAGHLRGDAHRGAANKYISDTEPWKLADDPVRRDTVLHTALQVVSDVNTLLTPFLPHAAQKVHQALGGTGVWAAQPEVREVTEEGAPDYSVIMGDYAAEQATWESRPIRPGTPLSKPTPLFAKLDEIGPNRPSWSPIDS